MGLAMGRNPKSAVLLRNYKLEDDSAEYKISEARESAGARIAKWRRTLYLGSSTSFAVLLVNLTMVLWASIRHSEHGQSVLLYSEDCDRVKKLSTGVHLLINILSTLLLAASNFAMVSSSRIPIPLALEYGAERPLQQCVGSPTREDVDRSHTRNEWLDIGVPSIRNLSRIPRIRLFFWVCLVLSSAPLHLLYACFISALWQSNTNEAVITPLSTRLSQSMCQTYTWRTRASLP